MENQLTLKLIDGEFSAKDSLDILLNLYRSKIHYHEMKNFSDAEKGLQKEALSTARIKDLRQSMEKIKLLVAECEAKNQRISIQSQVEIKRL